MKKTKFKSFIVTLILLIVLINLGFISCGEKTNGQTQGPDDGNNLAKEKVAVNLPKLLDLGSHKCIPCKKMEPILDELTQEYQGVFDVEFVDVWLPENKAIAHQHNIQSIPTQIFFDETGTEIWRHVGFISKADLLAKWQELGYDFGKQASGTCVKNCEETQVVETEPAGCCGK